MRCVSAGKCSAREWGLFQNAQSGFLYCPGGFSEGNALPSLPGHSAPGFILAVVIWGREELLGREENLREGAGAVPWGSGLVTACAVWWCCFGDPGAGIRSSLDLSESLELVPPEVCSLGLAGSVAMPFSPGGLLALLLPAAILSQALQNHARSQFA